MRSLQAAAQASRSQGPGSACEGCPCEPQMWKRRRIGALVPPQRRFRPEQDQEPRDEAEGALAHCCAGRGRCTPSNVAGPWDQQDFGCEPWRDRNPRLSCCQGAVQLSLLQRQSGAAGCTASPAAAQYNPDSLPGADFMYSFDPIASPDGLPIKLNRGA